MVAKGFMIVKLDMVEDPRGDEGVKGPALIKGGPKWAPQS